MRTYGDIIVQQKRLISCNEIKKGFEFWPKTRLFFSFKKDAESDFFGGFGGEGGCR